MKPELKNAKTRPEFEGELSDDSKAWDEGIEAFLVGGADFGPRIEHAYALAKKDKKRMKMLFRAFGGMDVTRRYPEEVAMVLNELIELGHQWSAEFSQGFHSLIGSTDFAARNIGSRMGMLEPSPFLLAMLSYQNSWDWQVELIIQRAGMINPSILGRFPKEIREKIAEEQLSEMFQVSMEMRQHPGIGLIDSVLDEPEAREYAKGVFEILNHEGMQRFLRSDYINEAHVGEVLPGPSLLDEVSIDLCLEKLSPEALAAWASTHGAEAFARWPAKRIAKLLAKTNGQLRAFGLQIINQSGQPGRR